MREARDSIPRISKLFSYVMTKIPILSGLNYTLFWGFSFSVSHISAMASVLGSIPAIPSSCTCSSFASSTVVSLLSLSRWTDSDRKLLGFRRSSVCRAMIQQAVQGAPAAYAKEMERLSAKESLLLAIESKFVLSTRLSVEGPLRMKEEYVEGILESPTVIEERVPEQLKGALGQAVRTMQQLPVPIWDAASHGLTIPLNNKEYCQGARSSNKVGCIPIFLGRSGDSK